MPSDPNAVLRGDSPDTGDEPVEADELPISMHERMLGVDIQINARAMHNELYHGRHPGGLSAEPLVRAVGSDVYVDSRSRGYIARWARSALFNGASPGGRDE